MLILGPVVILLGVRRTPRSAASVQRWRRAREDSWSASSDCWAAGFTRPFPLRYASVLGEDASGCSPREPHVFGGSTELVFAEIANRAPKSVLCLLLPVLRRDHVFERSADSDKRVGMHLLAAP